MSAGAEHGEKKEEIPPFLQWEAMTHEQINCLLKMTLDEVLGELGEVLGFRQRQSCMREVALLDYYVYGFWWAKESGFSPTQMSFCMAVLHMLVDNIRAKGIVFEENWRELAHALKAAMQQPASPGETAPLLGVQKAMALLKYIYSSLFQHYRLYEILFTVQRERALIGMERTIEVIRDDAIAPLVEGMSADMHHHDVAPPSSQGQEEDESGDELQKEEVEESRGEEVMEKEEEVAAWSIQDAEEVMSEFTQEMLGSLQAEFGEKLRLHEKTYTEKIGHMKSSTSK